MLFRTLDIPYEQAVYGSFAFWDRGYALLGKSEGCRDVWAAAFVRACQRFGEPSAGVAEPGELFVLRLAGGDWLLVSPRLQGRDDHGRPRALSFHGLFVRDADYRRLRGLPWALSPAFRDLWTASDTRLPVGSLRVDRPRPPREGAGGAAPEIAELIRRGRTVAIESPVPITDLATRVWWQLPPRFRRRKSLACWAFSNDNHFDLLGAPRLHGLDLPPSAVCLSGPEPDVLAVRAAISQHPSPRGLDWVSRWLGRRRTMSETVSRP